MLNVIICDDNKRDLDKISKFVDNYMKRNNFEYKSFIYRDYNDEFMKIVKSKMPFKIYILDIETPSRSGIDVAREIRKKDLESVIIFLTGHDELGRIILQNDLMFLAFVNKFDNFDKRLNEVLYKAIDLVKMRRIIKIEDGTDIYLFDMNDILYLSTESFPRRTIIKTDYMECKVKKPLKNIVENLDDRFVKTHKSCIINKNRVTRIDKVKKIIYFDNNEKIDLLSDKYKKELMI